jgi:hypothetical protein
MNRIIRAATATAALLLALPAAAMEDARWDDRRVEVEGPDGELYGLTRVSWDVVVDASPEDAWALLADFGGVQEYVDTITESDWIGAPVLDDGAARYCKLDFQGRDILVKERIFDLEEGAWFTYDVYDWTNFPLKRMHNTFGVTVDQAGNTVVYNIIDYKLKPAFLSGIMRGQLRSSARSSLLALKHYLETGEGDVPPDELDALYPNT